MEGWRDGGYSDDQILQSKCTEQGLTIATPFFALFPLWLDKEVRFGQYWNYLRRQLYVLDTYATPHNRRMNYALAALIGVLSLSLNLYALAGCCQLLVFFGRLLAGYWAAASGVWGPLLLGGGAVGAHGGSGGGWAAWLNSASTSAMVLSFAVAHCGVYLLLQQMCLMVTALAPKQSPPVLLSTFSWVKLWAAFLIQVCTLPVALAATFLASHIVWGGVTYHKAGGKVASITRPQAKEAAAVQNQVLLLPMSAAAKS